MRLRISPLTLPLPAPFFAPCLAIKCQSQARFLGIECQNLVHKILELIHMHPK